MPYKCRYALVPTDVCPDGRREGHAPPQNPCSTVFRSPYSPLSVSHRNPFLLLFAIILYLKRACLSIDLKQFLRGFARFFGERGENLTGGKNAKPRRAHKWRCGTRFPLPPSEREGDHEVVEGECAQTGNTSYFLTTPTPTGAFWGFRQQHTGRALRASGRPLVAPTVLAGRA